jgi:hypothetical protein
MPSPLRFALILPFVALAACDELAVADDPDALAELRGGKSCVAAVNRQTGKTGATVNTTLPVVEVNRFVIDVPKGNSWTCVTDNAGKAIELVEIKPR